MNDQIRFLDIYPLKFIVVTTIVLGDVLFFVLDYTYTSGLVFGVFVSMLIALFGFQTSRDAVTSREGEPKSLAFKSRVSLLGLAKYFVYGFSLTFAALIPQLDFFATGGGLLIPRFALQLHALIKLEWKGED